MNYKIPKTEVNKKLNSFQTLFRESGFKITPQREAIYKVLLESNNHPSIDEIYQKVKKQYASISLDTVYRNVESLEKMNLVNRICGIEGKNHFEANTTPHHHFICIKCHAIFDFMYEKANTQKIHLPKEILNLGKVQSTHLLVKGICKKCNSHK